MSKNKKPVCVFILGNGFSQGFGFPSFRKLWDDCLKISSKTENSRGYFEDRLGNYPLSYFRENNIADIELLLSVWSAYISSYEKVVSDYNTETSGRGHYEAYIENLCGHLLEYGDTANFSCFNEWLAEKMQSFEFRFITLNYDLLLEKIISKNNKNIVYLDNSTSEDCVIIRKLHGSVNWLKADTDALQRESDEWKPPILWENEKDKIYIYNINNDYSNIPYNAFASPPVLIPPILNKEYEGIFRDLLKYANDDLQKAKFVIIAGYSLPKSDFLIREFLKSRRSKFTYINPCKKHCNEAEKLFDNKLEIINEKWNIELFNRILEENLK